MKYNMKWNDARNVIWNGCCFGLILVKPDTQLSDFFCEVKDLSEVIFIAAGEKGGEWKQTKLLCHFWLYEAIQWFYTIK